MFVQLANYAFFILANLPVRCYGSKKNCDMFLSGVVLCFATETKISWNQTPCHCC
jgi:hypothetical protein